MKCTHLGSIRTAHPNTDGCEECLATEAGRRARFFFEAKRLGGARSR